MCGFGVTEVSGASQFIFKRHLSGKVSFEDELARATHFGHPETTHISTARSLEPTRIDGNNVNLDEETISSVDTVLRFQLATQAISGQYSNIRAAMRTTS